MKPLRMMKLAALALPMMLVACGTQKKAVKETTTTPTTMKAQQFLQKVNDNAQYAKFITSKVYITTMFQNLKLWAVFIFYNF